jgi:hypothetical protein
MHTSAIPMFVDIILPTLPFILIAMVVVMFGE